MTYICDSCREAVYDEYGSDEGLETAAVELGMEIADHNCNEWDKCECGCRRRTN